MPKTSGTITMRCMVGLLQIFAMIVFCVIVHKIDVATQSNTRLLAIHSEKIFEHQQNFEAIYLGTFSREFAHNLEGYIANEQGR